MAKKRGRRTAAPKKVKMMKIPKPKKVAKYPMSIKPIKPIW